MADEKPLPATPHKIKEAREEGNVAHSDNLQRSAICLVVFEALYQLISLTWPFFHDYFQDFIGQVGLIREHVGARNVNMVGWWVAAFVASGSLLLVCMGVVVAISWVQTGGPLLKKEPIKFSLESLNPISYFGKVFAKKTLLDIGNNMISALVITIFFYRAIRGIYVDLAYGMGSDGLGLVTIVAGALITALRTVLVVLLALAIVDFALQTRIHHEQLRMSHQDLKDEEKQLQGNMEMKGHVRQMGAQILAQPADGQATEDPLKGSNVLVVNPTHLAVGIAYYPLEKRTPRIGVKAEEAEAAALIDYACDHQVPVVRHIWLARTLYASNEGDAIPYESYKAVAAVYRVLERLARPTAPADEEVTVD